MNDRSPAFDTRDFRNALGMFPTGVAIVTTRANSGAFVGLTINSFSSLSLDPPLVLWSLNTRSPSVAAFERATHFAINILCESQVEMSRRFASSQVANKFSGVDIDAGLADVPLIRGSVAHIECRAHARHEGGDHLLFIGHVERFFYDRTRRPLVFHGGRYCGAGNYIE
jgi:flavin reductase (DIM6/NTAB) family NADH-FMN oxidoreductase RutF